MKWDRSTERWGKGGCGGRPGGDERMMGSSGKKRGKRGEGGDNPEDWSHVALAREENSVSL